MFESAGLAGVLPIALPGAAHPSTHRAAVRSRLDGDPAHPHRPVRTSGSRARAAAHASRLVVRDRPVLGLQR